MPPQAASGLSRARFLGDPERRSRARGRCAEAGEVATESRSLLLREGCKDIHTPPPPANEGERAAAHLP